MFVMKVAYCLVSMKQTWTDMKRHTILVYLFTLVERAVPTNVVIVCISVMSTSCDHLRIRCTSITTQTDSLFVRLCNDIIQLICHDQLTTNDCLHKPLIVRLAYVHWLVGVSCET